MICNAKQNKSNIEAPRKFMFKKSVKPHTQEKKTARSSFITQRSSSYFSKKIRENTYKKTQLACHMYKKTVKTHTQYENKHTAETPGNGPAN